MRFISLLIILVCILKNKCSPLTNHSHSVLPEVRLCELLLIASFSRYFIMARVYWRHGIKVKVRLPNNQTHKLTALIYEFVLRNQINKVSCFSDFTRAMDLPLGLNLCRINFHRLFIFFQIYNFGTQLNCYFWYNYVAYFCLKVFYSYLYVLHVCYEYMQVALIAGKRKLAAEMDSLDVFATGRVLD